MLLQALRAGVVPRSGLHHVQVGRAREVRARPGRAGGARPGQAARHVRPVLDEGLACLGYASRMIEARGLAALAGVLETGDA
jgi:hypothetical protein